MRVKKRKTVAVDGERTKKRKNDVVRSQNLDVQEDSVLDTGDDDRLENVEEHKAHLAALAEKDPEFYKFLQQQEADLLEFDESDIDNNDSEEETSNASASVDDVGEDLQEKLMISHGKDGQRVINQKVVDYLLESFARKPQPGLSVIRLAINSFIACASTVGADVDSANYTVNEEHVFEEVIRCCFQYLPKALYLLLQPIDKHDHTECNERTSTLSTISKISQPAEDQLVADINRQFRKWRKYRLLVKKYLHLVLLFLNELQTAEVILATLKTLLQLVNLCVPFKKLRKCLIKTCVRIWSRVSEECRCVAFMILCKIIRINKNSYTTILKSCYIAYVSNTRLITSETWPLITFMQKSFAEICIMHPDIAYHYAFVYIRQIAIHLRNAIIGKRKDLLQTVYNWQYMMCMYLWVRVVGRASRAKKSEHVEGIAELSYPLIQLVITTMKLYPTVKYFPLRLHCLRILLMAQVNCKVYIQTLALSVEMLEEAATMIRKKPTSGKGTVKAVDFTCLLKMTKPQLEDAGFRQLALEALFKLQLEAAFVIRNHCFFPDIMVPLENQIKNFVKQCRNVDHSRLFKSLSVSLNSHAEYVDNIVSKAKLDLSDPYSLQSLNNALSSKDSPLSRFYSAWRGIWNANMEEKKSFITDGSKTLDEQEFEGSSKVMKKVRKEKSEGARKRLNSTSDIKSESELQNETNEDLKQTLQDEVDDELRDLSLWDAD